MRAATSSILPSRQRLFTRSAGLGALIGVALLCGCSEQAPSVPSAVAVVTVPDIATGSPAALGLSSSVSALTLRHWSAGELPITVSGGSGPVTLRMERTDGVEGDAIEVSPATVTPDSAPGTLKLRPTKVAFPSPEGAAPWTLIASQGGKDVAHLDLSVTLETATLSFTLQPVSAREGQTADAVLTVDADTHDLPGFTFSLSPYIQEEAEAYEPVDDPAHPTTYTVTSLPATFHVPIHFKTFPGDPAAGSASFQMTVDGLEDTLGSNRYLGKYVRSNLTWNLMR